MMITRYLFPGLLGACILGILMTTTPSFDSVFQPIRNTVPGGALAQGRLYDARFIGWQTADQLSFDRYGTTITRGTQGIFLIVDAAILNAHESLRLAATWQGRSGRYYAQTTRADDAPSTLNTRQFHPGLDDQARAVFELPRDEIAGGTLLLTRKGLNTLDSELALAPPAGLAQPHHSLLRLE